MISQVAGLFLLEFAVGTLVFMLFMPLRDLKQTFFALNSGVAFLFALLYLFLGESHLVRGLALSLASLVVISYLVFLCKGYRITKIILILAACAGISALFIRGIAGIDPDLTLAARILGGISLILGALLLGFSYGTMILGHWYLVTPSLPFKYLVNASRVFVGTAIARLAFLAVTLALFFWFLGNQAKVFTTELLSFDELGLFFIMRIFWGLLGPLVLSFMILETAKIRHNQAATGILYVACIFVFIGELFADYLFRVGGIPS